MDSQKCHYHEKRDEKDWKLGDIIEFIPFGQHVHALIKPAKGTKFVCVELSQVEIGDEHPDQREKRLAAEVAPPVAEVPHSLPGIHSHTVTPVKA